MLSAVGPGLERAVLVWGNCQAAPIADLLRRPLARHGLRVFDTPPVHLISAPELDRVHDAVARCAVLVTQPINDTYHLPGCGSANLIASLRADAALVTLPVAFHVGAFPYQVHGHGAGGERVDAPITDYHDLRAIIAAHNGLDVGATLRWWPAPSAQAIETVRAVSQRELTRREIGLAVRVSDLLGSPDALWTMTHPTNHVLAAMARRVLDQLAMATPIDVPVREYLGERRAPLEIAVAAAHGWSDDDVRPAWQVRDRVVPQPVLIAAQLDFYRRRPDVVEDALARYAARLIALELDD